MSYVRIFDTTLRDGEQSPGCSMHIGEKLDMARQLERLRVDVIEAGMPVCSPEDADAVRRIASAVRGCEIAALSRCVGADIEQTWEAVQKAASPLLHVFLATSDLHLREKLHMSREAALDCIRTSVRRAAQLAPKVEFSAEDASRSDPAFLLEAFRAAAQSGARILNIPDTVGYASPAEMQALVRQLREGIDEDVILSVHCHNDLGLAVANSLAGVLGGAGQVETAVNGIGERAGNAALASVVMALRTRPDLYGAETNVDTTQLYRTSKLLSTVIGRSVPANMPVVGQNAFAHEAGIHQHGVIADRATYEIMTPESVGVYRDQLVLGKHSGKHAFAQRLSDLGYTLSSEQLDEAFERFKVLADRKKNVYDKDIEALLGAREEISPLAWQLVRFVVNSGTSISATAAVTLRRGDEELEEVARGEGPIDAAFSAIRKLANVDYELDSYSLQSVTEGRDALGEATVKLRKGHHTVTGRGLSTDVIEASIRAYVNGINKVIA